MSQEGAGGENHKTDDEFREYMLLQLHHTVSGAYTPSLQLLTDQ
jgi:hypothetical protein